VGRRVSTSADAQIGVGPFGLDGEGILPLGDDQMSYRVFLIVASVMICAVSAAGEVKQGLYSFGVERSCVASGKFNGEQCANAAANAQAEFDEKAPHFSTREECERVFGSAGCSVGFSGADGWAGKKSGVHFTPRQAGFRILASSEREMIVVPYVAGTVIRFLPRTILKKDTRIDPETARRAQDDWRMRTSAGASGAGSTGLDTLSSAADHEALPPRPPADPNFNCVALLEAGSKPETSCSLAPPRRR